MDELLEKPVFILEGQLGCAWLNRCDPKTYLSDPKKPAYELWFESFVETYASQAEKISSYRNELGVVAAAFEDAKRFAGITSDETWREYFYKEVNKNGG